MNTTPLTIQDSSLNGLLSVSQSAPIIARKNELQTGDRDVETIQEQYDYPVGLVCINFLLIPKATFKVII